MEAGGEEEVVAEEGAVADADAGAGRRRSQRKSWTQISVRLDISGDMGLSAASALSGLTGSYLWSQVLTGCPSPFGSAYLHAESYMLKDKATATKFLDSDLETYMAQRNAPKAAPEAAEAEAPAAMES